MPLQAFYPNFSAKSTFLPSIIISVKIPLKLFVPNLDMPEKLKCKGQKSKLRPLMQALKNSAGIDSVGIILKN